MLQDKLDAQEKLNLQDKDLKDALSQRKLAMAEYTEVTDRFVVNVRLLYDISVYIFFFFQRCLHISLAAARVPSFCVAAASIFTSVSFWVPSFCSVRNLCVFLKKEYPDSLAVFHQFASRRLFSYYYSIPCVFSFSTS